MGKRTGKFCSFVRLVILVGALVPAPGAGAASETAIIDYSTIQQIIDGYLGVKRGESQRRIAEERARLEEVARMFPTDVMTAYVVFARPVQGTELQSLVATYNLTLESIETNGTASRFGDHISERITDAQLSEFGESVALQVNTAVRELRQQYIAQGLALKERDPAQSSRLLLLASSSDFGIYRAVFKGRTIDFDAATSDPAVCVVILSPVGGKDWKRLLPP